MMSLLIGILCHGKHSSAVMKLCKGKSLMSDDIRWQGGVKMAKKLVTYRIIWMAPYGWHMVSLVAYSTT